MAEREELEGEDRSRRAGAGPGATGAGDEGVLTVVCVQCGKEYYFSEQPPDRITCEKCGGTVFRSFYTPEGDEAADDFRDETERDLDPDDAEGETMPGDVLDLNRD
jgi:ribosomal protein S27E